MATISKLDNNDAITAVTDSGATADPTLQTSDVKWFTLSNGNSLRMNQLPSNLATIFPNLIGLQWMNSRLRTIKPSDLAPYPNLVFFSVNTNLISKLDGNLFQNNHQLHYLDLGTNEIEEIGPGLLNGLNSLTYFNIFGNTCTGTGMQFMLVPLVNTNIDIQQDLDYVCGPSKSSQSSGSSQASGSCSSDPCLANCSARAAALLSRAITVNENVNAPWYYKVRLFSKPFSYGKHKIIKIEFLNKVLLKQHLPVKFIFY